MVPLVLVVVVVIRRILELLVPIVLVVAVAVPARLLLLEVIFLRILVVLVVVWVLVLAELTVGVEVFGCVAMVPIRLRAVVGVLIEFGLLIEF